MTATYIDQFKTEGAIYPIDILNANEVEFYRNKLTSFMEENSWKLNAISRHKPHMYLDWVNELGRNPKILEHIKPLLGEDILLWYSVFFVKTANSTAYVPWHQDATYWALNKNAGLTLWLALSEVNQANGCVDYLPGSHRWTDFKHSINNNVDNLLARGQEISNFQATDVKSMILGPGQASIHDVSLLHASKANQSNQPRLGIAFRYIPADNFPVTLKFLKRSATLVSGQKKHYYFIDDPNPKTDPKPKCLKAHKKSVRTAAIHTLFGDSARSIWGKTKDVVPTLLTKKTLQYIRPNKTSKGHQLKYSVLVTGASSGIGREFCYQLAENAHTMIITGRNESELSATAEEIKSINGKTKVIQKKADLCIEADRDQLISLAKEQGINFLILNAGGGNFGEFLNSDWQQEEKVIELNITSTIHLCNKLLPHLASIGRGQIENSKLILVSSHASYMRVPNFSVYASCKSFLTNFGLTLAQELKDQPVDLLVTCPGATESKFSERAGLPKKMLTTPEEPGYVVKKSLRSIGKKSFLITANFDKLIYFVSKVLPTSTFDRLISRTQKKLLRTKTPAGAN